MSQLTKQEQFFYDNAGWSYAPERETPEEGRVRCAKELAQAETWGRENNISFSWEFERESPEDVFGKACPRGSKCANNHCKYAHYNPNSDFYCCCAWDNSETPEVVASLGMIEEPSPEYRRVVEAELALEAQLSEAPCTTLN